MIEGDRKKNEEEIWNRSMFQRTCTGWENKRRAFVKAEAKNRKSRETGESMDFVPRPRRRFIGRHVGIEGSLKAKPDSGILPRR